MEALVLLQANKKSKRGHILGFSQEKNETNRESTNMGLKFEKIANGWKSYPAFEVLEAMNLVSEGTFQFEPLPIFHLVEYFRHLDVLIVLYQYRQFISACTHLA